MQNRTTLVCADAGRNLRNQRCIEIQYKYNTRKSQNRLAGHFRGVFTASCVFQVIFPGAFAVGSRLLSVRGIVKNVQKLFSVLPGLVEQGNILRIRPHKEQLPQVSEKAYFCGSCFFSRETRPGGARQKHSDKTHMRHIMHAQILADTDAAAGILRQTRSRPRK